MSNQSNTGGGIGFFTALGLLFIGLKLGGAIDWSWWWVLSPFWFPWAVLLTVLAGSLTAGAFSALGSAGRRNRNGSGSRWW